MKSQKLLNEYVDLTCYPILDPNASNYDDCIFGKKLIAIPDLHGNALKNLFPLVHSGAIQMNPVDYQTFIYLYYTPIEKWGKDEVKLLKEILERADINEKAANNLNLLFIGDDVGDRGLLDLINLLIFAKLHHGKVNFSILVSNHGMELICCYENARDVRDEKGNRIDQPFDIPTQLQGQFRISLTNMEKLIKLGIITRKEVDDLIETCYLPHLKIADYSVNKITQKPTVYTHASAGDDTLLALDAQLDDLLARNGLTHGWGEKKITQLSDLKSASDYATLIDDLNHKFEIIKHNKLIHHLYEEGSAFERLVWNRDRTCLIRNPNTNYVNGHDKHKSTENVYEIDCDIAKDLNMTQDYYLILNSYDFSSQDYRHLLNHNILDRVMIEQSKVIEESKIEIHKSFGNHHFVKTMQNDYNIDFMQFIFDERFIYSHYQFNNLKYLLIENKEELVNLFKDNHQKKLLTSIINENELHTLLDIISLLMKNDIYAKNKMEIFDLVLEKSMDDKYYLKTVYEFLLVVNETSKYKQLNIKDIITLIKNDREGQLLSFNCKNFHENLTGLSKGDSCYVDYFKLFNTFPADFSKILWMIKMFNLSGISFSEKQTEKNMQQLLTIRMNKLIEGMQLLRSWKGHGEEMINKLNKMIVELPSCCLPDLCNYLTKAPQTFAHLYMYASLLNIMVNSNNEITRESARRYTSFISLLVDKFNVGIPFQAEPIATLYNADLFYFKNTYDLLATLTDKEHGLSKEACKALGELIFSNKGDMELLIVLSNRFAIGDQFTGDTLLNLLLKISTIIKSLTRDNQIPIFTNHLNDLLPELNVNISFQVFSVLKKLIETLINNNLFSKYGDQLISLFASKECLAYIKENQSLSKEAFALSLNEYFIKTLQLPNPLDKVMDKVMPDQATNDVTKNQVSTFLSSLFTPPAKVDPVKPSLLLPKSNSKT